MPNNHAPLLSSRDWNEDWKELQKLRRRADDASYWDERAKTFATKDAPNPYVERFLELAAIRPGESVLDMGCGTGALAVPLGEAGHAVVAADFSQGMLDAMAAQLAARGITDVEPKRMSWDDDWSACGISPNCVDVAIASRSVATADLRDALLKLTDAARRRACVTLATASSPRTDERILAAVGLRSAFGNDHLYAFNILANEGLRPEVSYIDSVRVDTFDGAEEAFDVFRRMIEDAVGTSVPSGERKKALVRLRGWLADNLVENECAGLPDKKGVAEKRLRLREPRIVTWAFLGWDA